MEHKLILGGEEYLPFARSCVTKLKKLGLSHASQAFEVGGVSIKVRIEPGHEYIRIEGGGTAYMESGQLIWDFPHPENPTRYDAAKWHFTNILTDEKYLAKVATSPEKQMGDQKNKPLLSEGMDSQAIGFPYLPGATEEAKQKIRDEYRDILVMKKLVAAYFAPSLWSGKMRTFMQAQYGAKLRLKEPLILDLVGTEIILRYIDHKAETSLQVQLGLWSHSSCGIVYFGKTQTSPGGYWFITFTMSSVTRFVVKAAPIVTSSATANLLRRAHDEKFSAEERHRAETYVLSAARIDLTSRKTIHEFDAEGGSLAYGWKFQSVGTRASTILHKTLGTGIGDVMWEAKTVHCDFSQTYDLQTKERNVSVAVSQTTHGAWTDGWGVYNIFVPEYVQDTAPLVLHSLKLDRVSVAPDFDFFNIPVYGYYDSADQWVDVKLSRDYKPDERKVEQSDSGVTYGPGYDMNQTSRINYGLSRGIGFSYEQHEIVSGTDMTVSVGSQVFAGKSEFGVHTYVSRTGGGGATITNTAQLTGSVLGGYFVPPGAELLGPQSGQMSGGNHYITLARATEARTSFTGYKHHAWALVIPGCDCAAVYVSTHGYDSADGSPVTQTTSFNTVGSFFGTTVPGPGGPGVAYSFSPWYATSGTPGFYGVDTDAVMTTTPAVLPTSYTHVYCFNSFMSGEEGVPGGSYEPLFIVDKSYPLYARGMYMFTSSGGRYAMSEHANSPVSVNYQHRFVGWA